MGPRLWETLKTAGAPFEGVSPSSQLNKIFILLS